MSHFFLLYYTVDVSNYFANLEGINNIQYALEYIHKVIK